MKYGREIILGDLFGLVFGGAYATCIVLLLELLLGKVTMGAIALGIFLTASDGIAGGLKAKEDMEEEEREIE